MTRRDAYSPAWDGKPGWTEGAPHCQASGANATMGPWASGGGGLLGRWRLLLHACALGMPAAQGSLATGVTLAALHVVGAEAVMWMGWVSGQDHPGGE